MAISVYGLEFEALGEAAPPTYPTYYKKLLTAMNIFIRRVFNRAATKTEVCGTSLSSEVLIRSDSLGVDKVDILAFDNAAYITPVYEDGTVGEEMTVPRNGARSLEERVRGFMHRNVTPLHISTVEVVGWWKA